jgi:hypothetical protein
MSITNEIQIHELDRKRHLIGGQAIRRELREPIRFHIHHSRTDNQQEVSPAAQLTGCDA